MRLFIYSQICMGKCLQYTRHHDWVGMCICCYVLSNTTSRICSVLTESVWPPWHVPPVPVWQICVLWTAPPQPCCWPSQPPPYCGISLWIVRSHVAIWTHPYDDTGFVPVHIYIRSKLCTLRNKDRLSVASYSSHIEAWIIEIILEKVS